MTTKVTVDAHAGWPVKVKTTNLNNNGDIINTGETIVPAYTTQDFFIHTHMRIASVEEMPQI